LCLKFLRNITREKNILDLKKGEFCTISEFADPIIASKLLSMGILPNAQIQFVRMAPFGGAVYLKLNGFSLALRTEEAATILIKDQIDE
jgi:ferrous iron transport protein A